MSAIIQQQPGQLQTTGTALDFDAVARAVALDVAVTTNRVYQQTYRAWAAHCADIAQHPLALTPDNVRDFLTAKDTTKATRQRQLSALRKLAEKAHTAALLLAPDDAPRFEALRKLLADMNAPAPDAATQDARERSKKALTPAEADRLLRQWHGETDRDRRNRALVALLLTTGMRRSEAAVLRWRDIDFDNGVVRVRHGKGDKAREAAIAGDAALDALRVWQMRQPVGREYVFCPVKADGSVRDGDRPLTGTDVYRIMTATGTLAGVEFSPHDLRRTFITEALHGGAAVAEVQAQAGHSRAETTLDYVQTTSARARRKSLRLRYG